MIFAADCADDAEKESAVLQNLRDNFLHFKLITMQTTTTAPSIENNNTTDFLPLHGTDYVEFYVGNAKQAAHFYKTAFGFQSLAYAGPETGMKDKVSYVIRQHKLTFVLTTPLKRDNEIADHIYKHGDGVKVLALKVDDAKNAFEETTKRGAKAYLEPVVLNMVCNFIISF